MYSIFILLVFIFSFIFLFVKFFKNKLNIFLSVILSFLIIYFIIKPTICINASIAGLKLFITSILPTMFPFMVICNMLMYIDGISLYSKILGPFLCKPLRLKKVCSFPIVVSYLCGYPLGAKYSSDLYNSNAIDKFEFSRLINIASNIGPLFLIAAVGTSMLGNSTLGYLLLIPSYLSSILIGFLTYKKKDSKDNSLESLESSNQILNIGEAIKKSIENACLTLLTLAGYVVIFSVIIAIIKNSLLVNFFLKKLSDTFSISFVFLESLLLGSIEITNGCNIISSSNLSMQLKLSLISFLSSFGGLSIIAQTYSFFYKSNISLKRYFSLKLLQGVISFIIMYIISFFIPLPTTTFASYPNTINFTILPTILIVVLSICTFCIALLIRKFKTIY